MVGAADCGAFVGPSVEGARLGSTVGAAEGATVTQLIDGGRQICALQLVGKGQSRTPVRSQAVCGLHIRTQSISGTQIIKRYINKRWP